MPRVTVLMPTYNVAPYVREAVDSVLRQTFADFELLVIDDCSSDGTPDIVRQVADPRVRLEINDHNLGLADNLNRGLSLVTTELVARMDGDDIALPHWLEREVAILDTHPDVGVCSAGFERFGTQKSVVRFPEHHEDVIANMLFECSVIVPTFRMSLYREHGLRYRSSAFPAEDFRFWAECIRVTRIYNVQETLFHYRMHPTQICSSRHEEQLRKVAETRLWMLDWLSPHFTQEEKTYFTSQFDSLPIQSVADLRCRQAFARRMEAANTLVGHFEGRALRRRLDTMLVQTLYATATARFFTGGYSPVAYLRYLLSGLAWHTTLKYEIKFFLKSVLFKKV